MNKLKILPIIDAAFPVMATFRTLTLSGLSPTFRRILSAQREQR